MQIKLTLTFTLALSLVTTGRSQSLRRPPPISLSTATPATATPADTSSKDHYRFISIDIHGSTNAVANGINNDGLVTGYYVDSNSVPHGFVWREGRVEKVDYPGASGTYLFGINNRGTAIGYYVEGTANHAVAYSVWEHTWTVLPDIPEYPQNQGYGINDEGEAVGNAFSSSASVAWIWDAEASSYSFFTVPGAAASTTSPSGLNDKGQIAGYFADASGAYHGFLKEYGTYTTIDVPGALWTFLDGIDNGGAVQGQIYNATYTAEGFVATSGGIFTIVNYPGPMMTAVVGINDRGDLCGGYWKTFGVNTAFVAMKGE
jgi:probable HAF family extracellular repeat protein